MAPFINLNVKSSNKNLQIIIYISNSRDTEIINKYLSYVR